MSSKVDIQSGPLSNEKASFDNSFEAYQLEVIPAKSLPDRPDDEETKFLETIRGHLSVQRLRDRLAILFIMVGVVIFTWPFFYLDSNTISDFQVKIRAIPFCISYIASALISLAVFRRRVGQSAHPTGLMDKKPDIIGAFRKRVTENYFNVSDPMYYFLRHAADPNLPRTGTFDKLLRREILCILGMRHVLKIIVLGFACLKYEDFLDAPITHWIWLPCWFGFGACVDEMAEVDCMGWYWSQSRFLQSIRRECLILCANNDTEKAFQKQVKPEVYLAEWFEFLMVDEKESEEAQQRARMCLKVLVEQIRFPATDDASQRLRKPKDILGLLA
ncbi:hypothetical protein GLAREA_02133 [Glarea lozoyensis ATCC 20868]|uniref:Uncharacterized protein n=1 Tax=Glarea lozoyensis (strain ATCC 20868 / MF5171) TaxID=1116229 RepID=S3D2F3_GLAL2|nr:uncharacterized protein GLAREA_02133 [Glarea lozoyensis ATCC 20868]EPE26221.1 hypothetical protein GLAREA_02133 [Glarea lozoyensis ATCC 20868]